MMMRISCICWPFPLSELRLLCFSTGASLVAQQWRIRLQCRRHKRHGFDPWVRKISWRRKWQPTPVFLPEESHGQRNLVGCSPWGCKESDTTEQLSMHAWALYQNWQIYLWSTTGYILGFPGGSDGKESTCNAGLQGSVPGLGRAPGEGNGNPLQYSSLENPMDRGAWQAIVYGVAESQTWLSDEHFHFQWAFFSYADTWKWTYYILAQEAQLHALWWPTWAGFGGGGRVQDRRDILMTDLLCCAAETNITF